VSFIANGNLYNNESFASPTNSYEGYCTVISLYSLVLFFLFITLILTCCKCVAYKHTRTRIIFSIIFTVLSFLVSFMLYVNGSYLQDRISRSSWDKFFYIYGIIDLTFSIGGIFFGGVLRLIIKKCCCNFKVSSKLRKLVYCTIVILFEVGLAASFVKW
jgi:uncharacterized membrane protein (DUF485 family)